MGLPHPDILNRAKFKSSPATVAIGVSSARNGSDLAPGKYYLFASGVACFFKQGDSSVTAAVTDIPIASGSYFPSPIYVEEGVATDARIAVICASGSGTLFIVKAEV